MRKIKLVSMLLALALIVSLLAGCGGGSSTSGDNTNSSNTSNSSNTDSEQANTQGEEVTLSFLSWNNETTLQPLLDAFSKKYPNIKIDLQYAPPVQNYVQKFQILYSSNAMTDIFVTAAENKREVMENNMAVDLSNLPNVANLAEVNKRTYTDNNGKLIAFAPDGWFAGIFCNKKILADNGLSLPTNYTEYINVMKSIKEKTGKDPWIFSSGNLYDPLQGYVMTETIAKDPDYDKKVDSGQLKYKDGWTIPVQLWYNDYVKTGYQNKTHLGLTGDQAMQEFATGKYAFTVGATWSVATIAKTNPNLDYVMLPWFGTDNQTCYVTGAAGVGWSIYNKTKYPNECNTFLEFITSNESLKIYQKQTSSILAVKGIEFDIAPQIKDCYEKYFVNGKFYLPAVSWKYSDALGTIMLKTTQEIVAGTAKPEDLITRMDQKWAELNAAGQ